MQKIILVRYGEWKDGHINEMGHQTIQATAERLQTALSLTPPELKTKVCVVSAEVPCAVESAQILAQELGIASTTSMPQLYAAEEEGRKPDPARAMQALLGLERLYNREYKVVIAVASRGYIETLPSYVWTEVFRRPAIENKKHGLQRGQALMLDLAESVQQFI